MPIALHQLNLTFQGVKLFNHGRILIKCPKPIPRIPMTEPL